MQEQPPAGKQPQSRTLVRTLLLLSVLVALLYSIPRAFGEALEREDGYIPVPLHAAGLADYSVDGLVSWRYAADRSLIESAIRDRDPNAIDAPDRAARVVQSFETPVPTVTSQSLWSIATAAFTVQPATQSGTPSVPAESITNPAPTEDVTVTAGPSATPTSTPTPGLNATSTSTTNLPPAATYTPTSFRTATPSSSPAPPTAVPSSTPTQVPPTPLPSNTPFPSSTSSAAVCNGVTVTNFTLNGQHIAWLIVNNSTRSVELMGLRLDWPGGNDELVEVELAGDAIWDQSDDNPPTVITSEWKPGISRTIGVGQAMALSFQFEKTAVSSGYELRINLDIGCVLFLNH